jgi:hypothetical protein
VSDLLCAIHQPNFFPRLSTLAKLFTADIWVVLDDVQFARRDYQHRCPGDRRVSFGRQVLDSQRRELLGLDARLEFLHKVLMVAVYDVAAERAFGNQLSTGKIPGR